MGRRSNRRQFLRDTTLAGVGYWVAGGLTRAESRSANERLNIACIGVGGKGSSDTQQAGRVGNVVALCDADDNPLNQMAQRFPQAKKYNDFRKMFEEMGKSIDAVTVSTPDHTHAPASMMAMNLGKHVYCQKPLTHTVHEARKMRETAREKKVCTQMGNQGTASNGLRKAVEMLRAGVIGPIKEAHVWTNRPIWPQGTEALLRVKGVRAALGKGDNPAGTSVPGNLKWDVWLGPAPFRPYDPIYAPFSWRGWWDFGTGALGDMACHTANMAFMALKLGYPTSVVADGGEVNPETYPMWARITFEFPARGDMPPVKFVWYEGRQNGRRGQRVLPPKELYKGQRISDSGSLLVGEKGILYSPNDYGEQYKLLPEENFKEVKEVPQSLPRNGKGDLGMKEEWVQAIRENKPSVALSNFDYAAMLTETILLGNIAARFQGQQLQWDGPNMKFTNLPEANRYLKTEYREGWTL
jgi:predicted dehydrogenase